MKLRLLAATLAALTLAGVAVAQDTTSDKGKLSYALGYQFGNELAGTGEALDLNTLTRALQDAFAKKAPSIPESQMQTVYEGMQQRQLAKAKAAFDKAAIDNKAKSDAFLAQNKAKPGVKLLSSGTQYRIIEVGTGSKPTLASSVELEVSGPFGFGQRPASVQAPQKTPSIKMSAIEMPGVREALLQMPSGSKWEIAIPNAFGADMRTRMPPNAAVVYEVKLLSVK